MLCGNYYYFIICHVLSLFKRTSNPAVHYRRIMWEHLLKTLLSLLRTWWQIPNTQNNMHRKKGKKKKNQARSLNQDLKSTLDACFTAQTGKSTTNAEWAKMLQANNLGQESSEMVWFRPTEIKADLLHYFAKHSGISWFSVISWKVQTQQIRLD